MIANQNVGAITFLGRRQPPAFDVRYVAIEPGASLIVDEEEWHDELVVVERGEIELEGSSGLRRRFLAGDVLCFVGLSLTIVANRGPERALLSAVSPTRGAR